MAHLHLHLAVGLAVGTALTVVPLVRAWAGGRPLSGPIARMGLVALSLAPFAAAPSILVRLGAEPSVHRAGWANLFLGHAAIARRIQGGLLIGEVAIAAWLIGFYLLVLIAIARARAQRARAARATESRDANA